MASDDIPFDRALDARPDWPTRLSPLVRRLIANNGGPFTFTGTCTYLVGARDVTVIDPGPADPQHQAAILSAVAPGHVARILVTHSHKDHAPGAATLQAATGAPVLGCAPYGRRSAFGAVSTDASHDAAYRPDTALADGDAVEGSDHRLVALATPGHTANHLAFALDGEAGLFSGDHVMAWSTTVVAPPDGSMRDYMASLDKLQARADAVYWPGHGGPVTNPARFVRALAIHRRQRENAILARIQGGDGNVAAIVAAIYAGLPPALKGAAGLSVLAHLIDLAERDLVVIEGEPGPAATFRPR
ncbi:MBL fold metallo-hydrolase [Lichenihabitans sp. Uapishka_5]|uniref:MBL fold metallo-hydrolase n=1 Tax=Lichenihabitans sp. Uapishka_5 TaxID=3037302 RepID=UPI0029E7E10B|nr:MBL fold metallo-hydrolase [Lichenihabitans sp. Uapishka_5]MDX7951139.1 MBL fold metallo-hydrolase [Lichenihabitans sp. Uapishka_5]